MPNGNNRFKSGIFVDNFSTTLPQDTNIGFKNSVDKKSGSMRPCHYTTAIGLEAGLKRDKIPVLMNPLTEIIGNNIVRSGDVITLDFDELSYIKQPFGTRVENVTPFLVTFYAGNVVLFQRPMFGLTLRHWNHIMLNLKMICLIHWLLWWQKSLRI